MKGLNTLMLVQEQICPVYVHLIQSVRAKSI